MRSTPTAGFAAPERLDADCAPTPPSTPRAPAWRAQGLSRGRAPRGGRQPGTSPRPRACATAPGALARLCRPCRRAGHDARARPRRSPRRARRAQRAARRGMSRASPSRQTRGRSSVDLVVGPAVHERLRLGERSLVVEDARPQRGERALHARSTARPPPRISMVFLRRTSGNSVLRCVFQSSRFGLCPSKPSFQNDRNDCPVFGDLRVRPA